MQSSQNRGPLERPEGINSAAENERDIGAFLLWASPEARRRFRDLTGLGLKGSGRLRCRRGRRARARAPIDPIRTANHTCWRAPAYPFKLKSGQFFELGVQGYSGRFVSPTQAISVDGQQITPAGPAGG